MQPWKNEEEKFNIETWGIPLTKHLGELQRTSYGGKELKTVKTESSTSNKKIE